MYVDYSEKSPVILSYCTGIRGIERGLENAFRSLRWKQPTIAAFVEIESFICENLVCGMEQGILDPTVIFTDCKTFPSEIFRGKIDIIIGGYPCQPFSIAGQRKGTDDPRHLYPYFERDIRAIGPICIFFENVAGHLTLGFPEVRESLSNLGYDVEAGIFTAEEVGAPHKRQRLFILAIKRGYKLANTIGINRGLSEPNRREQDFEITGSGERELAAKSGLEGGKHRISSGNGFEQPSNFTDTEKQTIQELGNPQHNGQLAESELRSNEVSSAERWQEKQGTPFQSTGTDRPINDESLPRCKMADTHNARCKQQCRAITNGSQLPTAQYNRDNKWPSGPGRPQHDWEAPRTVGFTDRLPRSIRKLWRDLRPNFAKALGKKIWQETDRNIKAAVEPVLGITINGYNFREDLLRAAGNSVVEPCIELAFITLLEKHNT